MDLKDKRICGTIGYNNDVYHEDYFDMLNILDLPMENLEGDGLAEDWALKLGPIPSEVFREMLPPVAQTGAGAGSADLLMDSAVLKIESCQPKCELICKEETFKWPLKPQNPMFSKQKKWNSSPRTFEAPSPDSVLEGRIPVRIRSKRSRSGSANNPWSKVPLPVPPKKEKKKRRFCPQQPVNEYKKCSHCEITKTPQWREGPMGPKTLCNACGVRYRSGRLFPEYRPAASPTFVPSVHSNSHRKVIEMRQKGAGMDDNYVMKKHLNSNLTETRICSSG